MSGGYTDRLTDVEHSAEETGDPLTSILLLQPDNFIYRHWAANTLPQLALSLWTGVNQKGGLQFKSTYFTSERVSGNLLLACDTAYHARQDLSLLLRDLTPSLAELSSPLSWPGSTETSLQGRLFCPGWTTTCRVARLTPPPA